MDHLCVSGGPTSLLVFFSQTSHGGGGPCPRDSLGPKEEEGETHKETAPPAPPPTALDWQESERTAWAAAS